MPHRAHRPDAELAHATGRRRGRWLPVLAWIAAAPLLSTAAPGLWRQAQTWEPARANDGWPLHLGCLALEAGADPTSVRAWTEILDARGALDPATGVLVSTDVAGETRQVLANLEAVLAAAGAKPSDVLKTTVFLVDMADFPAMNEVYAPFFAPHKPARATVAVAGLPRGVRVEIECIAAVSDVR